MLGFTCDPAQRPLFLWKLPWFFQHSLTSQTALHFYFLCIIFFLSFSFFLSSFLPFFLLSSLLSFFYWSIVDLQCCTNLCCTAKWLSYTHTYILFFFFFFYILFHYGLSQEIGYSSLCSTVGPWCLSILNVILCIYQPQTHRPTLSLPAPAWQPKSVLCVYESVSVS